MYVELNLAELREVDSALSERIHEMQVELIHTDQRELRKDLRTKMERLEIVERRMHGLLIEIEPPI